MQTYLGIDGGGSKTRARLVDAEGKQAGYAESGPSNLNACDEATVRASLFEAIDACLRASGKAPSSTCLGSAGASSPLVKRQLVAMLEPIELGNLLVTSDASIALEGAFSGDAGILLIAGTGSVCFGRSASGKIHRTGGWGWLADDGGSAGWIGQRALEIALRQDDGRLEGRCLRDAVFARLGIHKSEQIVTTIYQPTLSRSQIAELSETILDLAQSGNEAALKIQQAALDELEHLVRTTAWKLEERIKRVAFTGGLLVHRPVFRKQLESRLRDFEIIEPQFPPVDGAVALARKIPA